MPKTKNGRPTRATKNSDRVVRFRCTDAEKRVWAKAANERGLSLSDFMRNAANVIAHGDLMKGHMSRRDI